jgi:DNA mismatch repair protein MutS2
MLSSIYSLREKMEAEEAGTRLALRDAEAQRDRLRQRAVEIEQEREALLYAARHEAQREVELIQAEIKRVRQKLRDAESLNQLKKLGKEVTEIEQERVAAITSPVELEVVEADHGRNNRQKRRSLEVGDAVLVRSINTRGEIISLGQREAMVAIGRLQMRVGYEDLEFKGRPVEEVEAATTGGTPHPSPGIELDIRGMRVEDGIEQLGRYLDSAFLARLPFVRIIHGKGTGRLRTAVREAITQNRHVRSWEEGKEGEGGPGVTVAFMVEP